MKRLFLSFMALCLCAVMSFAEVVISASQLPYVEDFESYGPTVTYTLYTTYSTNATTQAAYEKYVNYWTKAKVPTGWVVGNNTYQATSDNPTGGMSLTASATQRSYFPYIISNGTVTNSTSTGSNTANYYDKNTALTTYAYSPSGYNSLKLYNYYSSTASSNRSPAYAILPKLGNDVDITKLVVSGKAKLATTTTHIIEVGVVSDPTDKTLATFTKIGEFGPGKGLTNVYDPISFEFPLKDYTGEGRYIAFCTKRGATVSITAYLDDIKVEAQACSYMTPSISELKTNSAAINVAKGDDQAWQYIYTTTAGTEDMLNAATEAEITNIAIKKNWNQPEALVSAENTKQAISDLDANTTYYVGVRAVCDGGTYSKWKITSFKTLCTESDLDANNVYYTTGFNDVTEKGSGKPYPCWILGNANPAATASYIPYPNYASGQERIPGQTGNYLYHYASSGTGTMPYAVMPPITPENGDWSKVLVTLYAKASAVNKTLRIGIVNDPANPMAEDSWRELATITSTATTYDVFVVDLSNYAKYNCTGNCIALYQEYASGGGTWYIDSIAVTKMLDCAAPTSLEAGETTADSINFAFKGKAGKTYRVFVSDELVDDNKKAEYTKWVKTVDSVAMADVCNVAIDGLLPNTNYYLTVAMVCDGELSDFSAGMLKVRTACPEFYTIPFVDNFDNVSKTGSVIADCWVGGKYTTAGSTGNVTTSTAYPDVMANAGFTAKTGDHALRFNETYTDSVENHHFSTYARAYAITPMLSADLSNCMVRFFMRSNGTSTTEYYVYQPAVVVGVSSSNDFTTIESNFVALDTLLGEVNGVTYKEYKVNLSKYADKIAADAKYVVIKNDPSCIPTLDYSGTSKTVSYYSNTLIDLFRVITVPECVDPVYRFSATTFQGGTLNITPGKATDTAWQAAVIKQEDDNGEIDFETSPLVKLYDITATTYEITGLEPSTKYNVYMRTKCGEAYSEWSVGYELLRTQYKFVDSYTMGFEQDKEDYEMLPGASVSTTSYMIHPALRYGITGPTTSTSYSAMPYQVSTAATATIKYAQGEGRGALRIYNYYSAPSSAPATYYHGQYVIFPALDECSESSRSFQFSYRAGYESTSTGKMSTVSAFNADVKVGLVPKGTTVPTAENFILLETIHAPKLATTDEVNEANNYLWNSTLEPLSKEEAMNYQVCIWWDQVQTSGTGYFYVDNVRMTEGVAFEKPQISEMFVEAQKATVSWRSIANPVNVVLMDGEGVVLSEQKNVTDTFMVFTDLTPNTPYTVRVTDVMTPAAQVILGSDTRSFKTELLPFPVPFTFNFDDHISKTYPESTTATDSVYWSPDGWYLANGGSAGASTLKPYNWLVQRSGYSYITSPTVSATYDEYHFGLPKQDGTGSNSLRLYGSSSATYRPAYAVLPRFTAATNEMILEFYFRPASVAGTGKLSTISTEKKFYVVAMKDVADWQNVDTLAEIEYTEPLTTSMVAAEDPQGLEYFRKFQVVLANVDPKSRIALMQYGLQSAYLYVDDVTMRLPKPGELFAPQKLDAKDITANSATLTFVKGSPAAKVMIAFYNAETEMLIDEYEVANGTEFTVTGLDANTLYGWKAQAFDEVGSSDWTAFSTFRTECGTYDAETFTWGFEDNGTEKLTQLVGSTSASYLQSACWDFDELGTTTSKSYPQAYSDNAANKFTHTGDYCLYLYASRGTSSPDPTYLSRVTSPELTGLDEIKEDKSLKMYIRNIYHNKSTLAVTSAGVTYSNTIIVGVCSDPADVTTYTPLDTVAYTLNPTAADMTAEQDFGWQEVYVKLENAPAGSKHFYIQSTYKDTTATVYAYGKMYIDDIAIVDNMPILTTGVANSAMGKVSLGGAQTAYSMVTVTATANYGYEFVCWNNDETLTNASYTFMMPDEDTEMIAYFRPKKVTVEEIEGESFENETEGGDIRWSRVPGSTSDIYRQINGWTYNNAGTTKTYSSTYWPYNIVNSHNSTTGATTYQYSRTGEYALKIYSAATETYRSFVATPEISDMESLEGKQIEFWMRPLYCYGADYATEASRNKVSTTYATTSYAKSVIVGTCSNPADASTFHPLETVFYSKDVATTDFASEENNMLWEKVGVAFVNVPEGDKYIYIMAGNKTDQGASKACYMYIDDIHFGAAKPKVSLSANNLYWGSVFGAGEYEEGAEAEIKAVPNIGYKFVEWTSGETTATYTTEVYESFADTAIFEALPITTDIMESFEDTVANERRWMLVPGQTTETYRQTVGWTMGDKGGAWSSSYDTYNFKNSTSSTYARTGSYAIKVYASTSRQAYAVTPKIDDFETAVADGKKLNFWMRPTYVTVSTDAIYQTYLGATYAKSVIVGTCTDPMDVSTFVALDTITYSLNAVDKKSKDDANAFFENVTVELTDAVGPYIYFMGALVPGANYDYMYIDDVRFTYGVAILTTAVNDEQMGVVYGAGAFEKNMDYTIKAEPKAGYEFRQWSDGVTSSERVVSLTQDTTFTAIFGLAQVEINAMPNDGNKGEVSGSGKYEVGSKVTLVATPKPGYMFVNWSDNADGSIGATREITVTQTETEYVANFDEIKYAITVLANDPNMGDVTPYGQALYTAGYELEMKAVAKEGYEFVSWSDGVTDETRKITVSADYADTTFIANFQIPMEIVRTGQTVGNYYTICLDKSVKKGLYRGAEFYAIESRNNIAPCNAFGGVNLVEVDSLIAGVPYIYKATAVNVEVQYGVEEAEEAGNMNGLYGVFTKTTLYSGDWYLGAEQKFITPQGAETATVAAGAAYINSDEIAEEAFVPAGKKVGGKTATIDAVNSCGGGTDVEETNAVDAAGKYLNEGNLMIVVGDKTYNAQGATVK